MQKEQENKKLLFCIGISDLASGGEVFIEKLKRKFDILQASYKKSKISVDIVFFPNDLDEWKKYDYKGIGECLKLCENYPEFSILTEWNQRNIIEEYDAFYGSPSPLVVSFNEAEKPVMLMDLDV